MKTESLIGDRVYVFNLHLICGGYAYFSTLTKWAGEAEHGREVRAPSTVSAHNVVTMWFEPAGLHAALVRNESDLEYWMRRRGWALVGEVVAQGMMGHWLQNRVCLKNASSSFTDIGIASNSSLGRGPTAAQKRHIRERDGETCVICGKTQIEGAKITMHHIRPHSRGGPSLRENLVCACEECNQEIGDETLSQLYEFVGEPWSVDWSVVGAEGIDKMLRVAMEISDNLMHTRCEVF